MSDIYSMAPYKHNFGQKITTDAEGVAVDRAFLAHIHIDGEDAPAQDLVSVLAATALIEPNVEEEITGEQTITKDIESPAYPRNLRVKGSAATVTGKVTIKGLNIADEEIEEEFTLAGADTVEGDLAFAAITEIELPPAAAESETVSVGVGNELAMPYILAHDTILAAYRGNTVESTAPTLTTDAKLEKNTVKLSSALNGTDVDIYLMV